METNTELLNRIEAHIKGRLAVAESRAASSELYEGKMIAYTSILGVVKGLRADCAAQAQLVPSDEELDFSPATDDWAAYRREAAKDILCALLQKDGPRGYSWWTIEQAAQTAVKQADELIKQLKEK